MTDENQNDSRDFSVGGNVERSAVVLGDGNTVTYTTNVFSAFEGEAFPARPSQQLSQQEYRWRQVLVQNVKHYWIEGVLERSLHNQALVELGLEERTQAVTSPITGVEEFSKEAERPFPEGTKATDIFDNLGAGRTLLILGEPGAGKTTTLLRLAKTLLARIGDDFSQPIPVILNLSSWAKKRKPIAEWLVQALYETFQVSKALGNNWIKDEQLQLCLDGLDEVAVQHRNDCVEALNHFLQNHGRTEVVVCSRIRDYEVLFEQLRVKCAIYVQPLTDQQVDRYLEQTGEQLSALRTVFSRSPEIRKFAASPLILSVMSLAYQGYSLNEFPEVGSAESFRQRLFDTYIERMFLRRGKSHNCTKQQAKHWLIWIAQQMVQNSQTVFFIENMQPSCLQPRGQRLWYSLENSLIFGLLLGLLLGLSDGLNVGLFFGLSFGLSTGVSAGLSAGLRSWLFGSLFGCWFGWSFPKFISEITPVETLNWSWKVARKSFRAGLRVGLRAGLFAGIFFGLRVGLRVGLVVGLFFGLHAGLFGFLPGSVNNGLIFRLRGPKMVNKTKPNQGIWRSARNTWIFTLIFGLVFGLISGLIFGPMFGLGVGPGMGMISGLIGGGSACLRHFSLRLRLYRMGYAPWNYARFLDYAAERLFLQKVGGGYIFIHRMLLEHFAQMTLDPKPSK